MLTGKKFVSILTKLMAGCVWVLVALFWLWAIGAIYHLVYLPFFLRVVLAFGFASGAVASFWRSANKRKAQILIAVAIVFVYLATLVIRPSNDRNWHSDQTKVADVLIVNGQVTIKNFRHCHYRSESDFDVRFETKQFQFNQIESVWLIVQRFTTGDGPAHVFLSFGLKEGSDPLFFSISVEIWREQDETYDPIRGLYRSYEITHVIGDERDLIGVRTVHRPGDRVFLYRINANPEQAQQLFLKLAKRIQELRAKPQFYHTFLNNCANGITRQTYELTPKPINWLDPRIVFPGYSGQFAFEHGLISKPAGGHSFEELQQASRIDEKARIVGITPTFSRDIREGQQGK